MNLKAKGYALGAIAATTYGMNPLFALPLYKAGMNPDSVLFFRYLCAIPIMALMIRARGRSFKLKKNEILPLIVMGLMMALSSLTLFLSYNYMDAGIASTILFVYPIMVAVIMALFFKEKLTKATICCLVLAIYGITQLYHGDGDETLSLVGVGLAMTSALTYAIYIVGANRSVLKDIPTVTMTFDILYPAVRIEPVLCPSGLWKSIADSRPMVSVGEYIGVSCPTYCLVIPLHHASYSIYWLYTDGYSGSIGTSYGCILRCIGIWRSLNTSPLLWYFPHLACRNLGHCRRKHQPASGTFPQTFPQITTQAAFAQGSFPSSE